MEQISIDQLYERVQNLGDNDLILDVRSPSEYSEGHIPGARNTPHEDYVHCKMGGRAKIASQTLNDLGLNNIVCVGDGGMQRWREMGWPVE
jgi:rhodanese-related sulfurtransferase